MSNNPLVSIILPTYNVENFIEEAVDSIFSQTYDNYEVIIIDDGSTDNTFEILHSLQSKYSFSLEKQTNQGHASSLNNLIKKSKGKYIANLDSDDTMYPNRIQLQVDFLEKNPSFSLVSGNLDKIDIESKPLKEKSRHKPAHELTFESIFVYRDSMPGGSFMGLRSSFIDVGMYTPGIVMQDRNMLLRMTRKGFRVYNLSEKLGTYRIHGSNIHDNYDLMFANHLQLLEEHNDHELYPKAFENIVIRNIERLTKKQSHHLKYAKKRLLKLNKYKTFARIIANEIIVKIKKYLPG